tara:strand:+ start:109759 stop:110550 length:792 start_codon:yes stop_codon:yes gene_type:complete
MNGKLLLTFIFAILTNFVFSVEKDKNVDNSYKENNSNSWNSNLGATILIQNNTNFPGTGFLLQSQKPSNNWLFIYHDRWGVTENVKMDAYSLWRDLKNVNVLVIDLNNGLHPSNNKEAIQIIQNSDTTRNRNLIAGAIKLAGPDANIASMGWCYGGSWAMQSAIQAASHNVGCVVYYGMPEFDTSKLKDLSSEVFAIFGDRDTYITESIRSKFQSSMGQAGKQLIQKDYHTSGEFANRNSENYNFSLAANAYSQVLTYLASKY